MKTKKLRFSCWKCDARFISWQARDEHMKEAHQPPKKTEKKVIRENEYHRLVNGLSLNLGDKVHFDKDGVITKITITEGSSVAECEISVLKDSWSLL
jgi:hypothetical protein